MANKVKFNLKNVHYAVITLDDSGKETYGTPVAIPGAVSLSLDAQGDIEKFYADGKVYYQSAPNNGYDGTLEMALIPDSFRTAIFGEEVSTTSKVLLEKTGIEPKAFALGFQIDGDDSNTLFWYLNCAATRPNQEASTTEDSKTPQTESLSISMTSNSDDIVRVKSTSETTETVISGWWSAVVTA